MKILQIIYESRFSPFGFGGAGVRAYEIYNRLSNRHDITLLCMKYPGAMDGTIYGLEHKFVGTESRSLYQSVLAFTIEAARYLRKHGNDYDIVVENFLPATPFLGRCMTGTPVVLQIQGIMGRHAMKKYGLFPGLPMYIVEKIYPRFYRNYIFVTQVGMDSFMKRAESYFIIPNGVEVPEGFCPHPGDYILFLSRIDIYTKGLDILVEAFSRVARAYPEIKLLLAGYEFDSVKALLGRVSPDITERIEYMGFLEGRDKWSLLMGARVFVLPSRHEANPVSLIEALAAGVPVVVSDIPEMDFINAEGLGLTFRTGSVDSLTEKLLKLLEDPELSEELSRKGRQYSGRFRWDRIAVDYETALMEIAG